MDDLISELHEWTQDLDIQDCGADGVLFRVIDRIEQLEAEVLRIGEVLDTVPSVALEWTSTDQPPPDFAERLLKAWGKIAIETLRNSEYQKLLRAKYAPTENGDE